MAAVQKRRKTACKSCHERRVRCDASERRPCSNCAFSAEACEMVERTPRRKMKMAKNLSISKSSTMGQQQYLSSLNKSPSVQIDQSLTDCVQDRQSQAPAPSYNALVDSEDISPGRSSFENRIKEGSEMLFSRLADSKGEPSPREGYDGSNTIYLGESFNLTFVVQQTRQETYQGSQNVRRPLRLHYPLPKTLDKTPTNIPYQTYDALFEQEEQQLLRSKGVFTILETSIHERLLETYFTCFHPAFPLLDKKRFLWSLETNRFSYLLLQAVYFVGTIHCDPSLITEAGFSSRYAAMLTFFKRAKALYDADHESDSTVLVQALLLMSWWWGGPIDQKDTWHWLGVAISLAQTKGLHRSTAKSDICRRDQKTWKRIWWSLYIRDRHSAAGLGRPPRIDDKHCDVEMLKEEDFEEQSSTVSSAYGVTAGYHVPYFIQMAKLAIILGKILATQYATKPSNTREADIVCIAKELSSWKDSLPAEIVYTELLEEKMGKEFWANMLQIAYNKHLILLHRPTFANTVIRDGDEEHIVVKAAGQITRMVEDMLPVGLLRKCQLHVGQSLFAALSVHIIGIRRSGPVGRELASQRARICMLGLSEMQLSWPVAGWILRLFSGVLESLSKQHNGWSSSTSKPLDRLEPPLGSTNSQPGNPAAESTAQRSLRPPRESVLQYQGDMAFALEDDVGTTHQLLLPSPANFAEQVDDQLIFRYGDMALDLFAHPSGLWEA